MKKRRTKVWLGNEERGGGKREGWDGEKVGGITAVFWEECGEKRILFKIKTGEGIKWRSIYFRNNAFKSLGKSHTLVRKKIIPNFVKDNFVHLCIFCLTSLDSATWGIRNLLQEGWEF